MHRLLTLVLTLTLPALSTAEDLALKIEKGTRIAILGSGFADRLQHTPWFEALLHKRFSSHELVVRNLGFTADEVTTWHRSQDFGSQDEWLGRVGADLIFAFWGFNESFQGPGGIDQFKSDLGAWVDAKRAQTYAESAPEIVLFSPIAAEETSNPDLPDVRPINQNLALYTAAIKEVAFAKSLIFVDLFKPSQDMFAREDAQLTINGIHLKDDGYKKFAGEMFGGLFGGNTAELEDDLLAKINDKNQMWFSRYRTVDGYNVYGGRSKIVYEGISNFQVMQEEMTQRDVLTANRDKKIWAFVQNKTAQVPDDNLPPVTEVPTNLPEHRIAPYPDPEEAISKMVVHSGMQVNLFASEKEFPELANPVQMAWDTKNRLWVAAWPTYPAASPTDKVMDKLLVFEDTDWDGKADKMHTFADGLNSPTGFQFYKDGVLVMQAPDVWFLRDTDGDGKADWKQRILNGIDSADTHHTTNAMAYDPGGGIYLSDGVFHRTQVETSTGPKRNVDGSIYRFVPRTGEFDWYMAHSFANPHGKAFDRWGNDFITDATGNVNYFGSAASGYTDNGRKHARLNEFWRRPSRPCPATEILSSAHFPEEFQGNFLNANVISFQGIFRVGVTYDGSGPKGETLEHLIYSDPKEDQHFRPICMSNGPDGALYFCDWSQTIIGHLQHHLRDPNRDHQHGRIYRITYKGRPLADPPKISGQPIDKLLDLLASPVNGTRLLAKIQLDTHPTDDVIAAADRRLMQLKHTAVANLEHYKMEILWLHQWHNVVNESLLEEMLASTRHEARAAAGRVLCYWRDRVSAPLEKMRALCSDPNPRARLEGIRMASFYNGDDAIAAANAALLSRNHPSDDYLDYILKETMQQLEPWWRPALVEGKIATDNPAGAAYLLSNVNNRELLAMPRIPAVLDAWLTRPGLPEMKRLEALLTLSGQAGISSAEKLLQALESKVGGNPDVAADLGRLLNRQPANELGLLRARLVALSTSPHHVAARPAALAAIMLADGNIDTVWDPAQDDPAELRDALEAVPWIADPALRATAHDRVAAVLTKLPKAIDEQLGDTGGTSGRYVRISLPRSGILTLAEVQVFSNGTNIAPTGKASQSSVGSGGVPERAIDGDTNGIYGAGTSTHTREPDNNPWWELDLGRTRSIDAVALWNRTGNNGAFVKRLGGFTLEVLDNTRRPVFSSKDNPAPPETVRIETGGDPRGAIQHAAINALVSTHQQPAATFKQLCSLIQVGENISAASRGLRKISRDSWDTTAAGDTATSLHTWAKTVPAEGRTAQDFIENIQVAKELATYLPDDQAKQIRTALNTLGVDVTVIRTVHEQLRYDTTEIVVEAGKPFEIVFENDDVMPHNLIVCQAGARQELGTASATMTPDQLDSKGRAYVPDSKKIITATKMLEAGESARLPVRALPAGEYEYVCTFPGHWTLMWGKIIAR